LSDSDFANAFGLLGWQSGQLLAETAASGNPGLQFPQTGNFLAHGVVLRKP